MTYYECLRNHLREWDPCEGHGMGDQGTCFNSTRYSPNMCCLLPYPALDTSTESCSMRTADSEWRRMVEPVLARAQPTQHRLVVAVLPAGTLRARTSRDACVGSLKWLIRVERVQTAAQPC
jgi:hypothetical protein